MDVSPSLVSLQRKNDREAIRRRLAMGEEDDYFTDLAASRPIRKPNLQSRLQNGAYKSSGCVSIDAAGSSRTASRDSSMIKFVNF